MALGLWLLYPRLRSRTGYANARVRHIAGSAGYYAHCYLVAAPNLRKWLTTREPLFPAVLQVQTINRCNATCPMCPYPYTTHLQPREVMDDALFTKIVDECAAAPELVEFVPMAKNEPLMDAQLETRIAEFKAKAAPHQMVELVTNGSALTPARFARLVESGVDLLTISLSANSEEAYHKVMPGLSWRRLMQNLESVMKSDTSKVNLFLRFIKQRDNIAEVKSFTRLWRKRGFNVLAFEMNDRSGTVKDYERMATARGFFVRHMRRAMGQRMNRLCPHAFSIAHVLQNGDVPLCTNDWQNREILGNVRRNTIREIYNIPRAQEIRELMRQGRYEDIGPCRDCSFWRDWL